MPPEVGLRAVKSLLLAVILACFAYALWHYRDTLALANLRFDEGLLYLSVAGSLALTVSLGLLWMHVLQRLSPQPLPRKAVLYVHLVAWLGRYTPGKLGLFLGKALLGGKLVGDGRAAAASVVYENILFIASGMVLAAATVGLPGLRDGGSDWLTEAALVLAVLAGLIAAPRCAFWVLNRARRWFPARLKALAWEATLDERELAVLCVFYCVPHVCAGLGFYALVCLLAPGSGVGWVAAIGVLTAAHLAGILAVFAPAGLGVREAALGALLLAYMPPETAVSLAVLARLTSLVADLAVFAVVAVGTLYARCNARLF